MELLNFLFILLEVIVLFNLLIIVHELARVDGVASVFGERHADCVRTRAAREHDG